MDYDGVHTTGMKPSENLSSKLDIPKIKMHHVYLLSTFQNSQYMDDFINFSKPQKVEEKFEKEF